MAADAVGGGGEVLVTPDAPQSDHAIWLRCVERAFRSLDIGAIMPCFTEDVLVHYNLMAPLHGRAALQAFFAQRYAGMSDYHLVKRLRSCSAGPTLGVEVRFDYIDMGGARWQGKGFEYLRRKGSRIAVWDYVCTNEMVPAGALATSQAAETT